MTAKPRRPSPEAFAIVGLVALLVCAYGDILFFGRGLYVNDLTAYHLPMKSVVRTIVRGGEFPFWNPYYSGGQPLAANPAYEVFYPPQWLLLVLPLRFGFQLHILLHIAIAAIAMFLLLHDLKLGIPAALFGSIAFVFGGPYLSLSSMLPLFFSVTWMPVVLLFTRRAFVRRNAGSCCAAAFAFAMPLVIGEPAMAMQTVGLMVALAFYDVFKAREHRAAAARKAVGILLVIGVAAAGIAAVQLVPGVDHVRDSVRSRPFEFWVVSNWSMPPQRIVEWALPSVFRHVPAADGSAAITSMYIGRDYPYLENIYLGVFVVLLVIGGLFARVRGAGAALAVVAVSVVFALGNHTPLLRLLYDAHLFHEIRYPEKFILTAAFALAIFAAVVADRLIEGDKRVAGTVFSVSAAWVAVSVLLAVAGPDAPTLGSRRYFIANAVRAGAAFAAIAVLRKRRDMPVLIGAAAVAFADLVYSTSNVVPRMPAEYFAAPPIARAIAAVMPPSTRVYHEAGWMWRYGEPYARSFLKDSGGPRFWWLFRNGMFPNVVATYGFPVALEEDIDLTSLLNTDELREAFKAARLRADPTAVDPYLRLANIGVRLRFPPLMHPLQEALDRDPEGTTPVEVVRAAPAPRYSFAQRIERVADADEFRAAVSKLRSEPNVVFADIVPFTRAAGEVIRSDEHANAVRLDVRASGRAVLVISVTAHKYWRATIDGHPAQLLPANLAFQAMIVPGGNHRIELRYANPLIAVGGAISVAAIASLIGAAWIFRNRPPRPPGAAA